MCILYALVSSQSKKRFTPYQWVLPDFFQLTHRRPLRHPVLLFSVEVAIGLVERNAALRRELDDVGLALVVALRLEGL